MLPSILLLEQEFLKLYHDERLAFEYATYTEAAWMLFFKARHSAGLRRGRARRGDAGAVGALRVHHDLRAALDHVEPEPARRVNRPAEPPS